MMRLPRRPVLFSSVVAACCALVGAGLPPPVAGAQTVAVPAPPANVLDSLRYNPAERGALLLVGQPFFARVGAPPGRGAPASARNTLRGFADAIDRRIVTLPGLTVLAPKTMQIIVERPGKPDPYAGLKAEERFKVLLSLLDESQWKQAGSERGIGPEQMTDEQRALFEGLLPAGDIAVQQTKLVPTDKPNVRRYEPQGEVQEFKASEVRLRLARKIEFGFSKMGADDYSYGGGPERTGDETIPMLRFGVGPRGDVRPEPGTVVAFGVPIVKTVSSRLKTGDLDLAAPVLNAGVSLDGEAKTLGDLLARAAEATGLDLVADRRVAGLAVFVRAREGQRVRTSHLLQALCWSVTGAFRKVGESTYLLSDDVQGIGTRWARLAEWGEAAESVRYKAMQGLLDAAAKRDPLSHLRFAPGDPYALSPEQLGRVDAAYRKARYTSAPEFKFSELSPALQRSVEQYAQRVQERGVALRTDRLRVGTQLLAQFVFPGGLAVEPLFAMNFDHQYLQAVAAEASKPDTATAAKPEPPQPLPAALKRRVLLAQLAPTEAETAVLLALAKTKGFGEVWLHVPLDDTQTNAKRLSAAVEAGKKMGVAVGAAVSLLRGDGGAGSGGVPGAAQDVNIFGETGVEFAERRAKADPSLRAYYQRRTAGWTVLNAQEATRRLAPLARLAGLCALALRATAAPGWVGHISGGDGIPTNGHLGYTPTARLACIRAQGFDPVDTAPYSHSLRASPELPFFGENYSEGLWKNLNEFRLGENKAALAVVYAALQQAAPRLPLYLDDRASPYTDPHASWYGRWDAPGRVPVNPVYAVESEGREAAFHASSEPLLNRRGRAGGAPGDLACALGESAQKATKNWRGLTLDLAGFAPAEALKMLAGLPDAPPPVPPAVAAGRAR